MEKSFSQLVGLHKAQRYLYISDKKIIEIKRDPILLKLNDS